MNILLIYLYKIYHFQPPHSKLEVINKIGDFKQFEKPNFLPSWDFKFKKNAPYINTSSIRLVLVVVVIGVVLKKKNNETFPEISR